MEENLSVFDSLFDKTFPHQRMLLAPDVYRAFKCIRSLNIFSSDWSFTARWDNAFCFTCIGFKNESDKILFDLTF